MTLILFKDHSHEENGNPKTSNCIFVFIPSGVFKRNRLLNGKLGISHFQSKF